MLVKPACWGAACLVLAIACFVVSGLPNVPDESTLYIVTWIGGVVLGALGIYLLVVAFPLREIEPLDDGAERPNSTPPPTD